MKIEDQVCSKDLGIKLENLGVKQESLWYWKFVEKHKRINNYRKSPGIKIVRKDEIILNGIPSYISAFTVAELGEILPPKVRTEKTPDGKYDWMCILREIIEDEHYIKYWCFEDTEADARAKMLIYLIENKLIEVKK